MSNAEQTARPHAEREVEQKFRVHGLFRVPDLSTLAGVSAVEDLGVVELESAYYDTDDLRLAREGITLRRRVVRDLSGEPSLGRTGDDEGWHLKLPVTRERPGARDELRLPLEAAADAPPGALTDVVRVIVRTAPIVLVSRLRTTRSRQVIRSGAVDVAELADDTVHVVDADGDIAARFRELELEERDGGPVVDRVSAALTTAGAVGGEFVAKAVRALGPNAATPAEVPEPSAGRPEDPARAALIAYLARHVRALRSADLAFRCEPADPEAVHQLRVAARRLRSGLRTFRSLLDKAWAQGLRAELAWFARSLGELREGDVLWERLDRHCGDLPADLPSDEVRALLSHVLGARVTEARARVATLLNTGRYVDLHERLVLAAQHPATTPAAEEPARDALPPLVDVAWQRLAAASSSLTDDAPDEHWHAARLEAKRTRYAAEAVAPTLGRDAKSFAGQMEQLTDILGEHQDAAQAAATARSLAGSGKASPDVAFTLGVLASNERDHVQAARERFASVWPQARRVKWRRWLAR